MYSQRSVISAVLGVLLLLRLYVGWVSQPSLSKYRKDSGVMLPFDTASLKYRSLGYITLCRWLI